MTKICYMPYELTAFCAERGIHLRSLYALFTSCKTLDDKQKSVSFTELFTPFILETVKRSVTVWYHTFFFAAMQHYVAVSKKQKRIAMEKGLTEVIKRNGYVNDALGYSCYYKRNFKVEKESSVLDEAEEKVFYIDKKGNLVFPLKFMQYEPLDKDIHIMELSLIKNPDNTADDIMECVIATLSEKGFFRHTNMQLVEKAKDRIVLLVDDVIYDGISTFFITKLHDFGRDLYGKLKKNCVEFTLKTQFLIPKNESSDE